MNRRRDIVLICMNEVENAADTIAVAMGSRAAAIRFLTAALDYLDPTDPREAA